MWRLRGFFWLNGLFLLAFGAMMVFATELALRWIVIAFALESLFSLAYVWTLLGASGLGNWRMGLGSVAFAQLFFALALLFFPSFAQFLLSVLVVIIAVGVVIFGARLVRDAFLAKRLGLRSWRAQAFLGLGVLILGVYVMSNAFLTVLTVMTLMGVGLMISGISLIIKGFRIKQERIVFEIEADDE